jgi:putative aldouronate transport system substrate-binding protein
MKRPMRCIRNMLAAVTAAALLLNGCAGKTVSGNPADGEKPAKEVTLNVLAAGISDAEACRRISELVSQKTRKELGFAVNIEQTDYLSYNETLSRKILLGNEPDLFCCVGTQFLLQCIDEKYVNSLGDNIDDYWGITRYSPNEVWSCVSIDGQIYAVPANNGLNYSIGFLARADIMQALGEDPAAISSWDGLYALLKKVKQYYPEMVPVVSSYGQVHETFGEDPLGDDLGVLIHNSGNRVENLYSSGEYLGLCKRMHQWNEEGLIQGNDAVTQDSGEKMMQIYNGFGFFTRLNDKNVLSAIRSSGLDLVPIYLGEPIANSSSINFVWCISSDSQYKRQAMKFLELMYSDHETADLCIFGEQDTDYKRIDKDTVTGIQPVPEHAWSAATWAWPNRNVASSWKLTGQSYVTPPEKGAKRSPAMGFLFNSEPVQAAVNRCRTVTEKYGRVLTNGYLDPDEALPRFLNELEEAGINDVITEKQKQLDQWMSGPPGAKK